MERLTRIFEENNQKYICIDVCKEKCVENNTWCPKCEPFTNVLNKLARYEDAEEQGLLLRLPVPEGAVVYTLSYIYECKFDYDCKEFDAYKCEEDIYCEHQYKVYRVKETKFQKQMLAMLCKTVFLTKEEAEQALARMEKENG